MKIHVTDRSHLILVGAFLQDSLVHPATLHLKESAFTLKLNRFMWELFEKSGERQRVETHLQFENVTKVETCRFSSKSNTFLNFLGFFLDNDWVVLTFSEKIQIRLKAEPFSLKIKDVGISWKTDIHACHEGVEHLQEYSKA